MWSKKLVGAVDGVAGLLPDGLSLPELQELASCAQQQAQRLLGIAGRALAELQVRSGGTLADGDGRTAPVLGWWRDATCSTGATAGRQVRVAVALRDLPLIAAAVADGRLGAEQAAVLSRLHGTVELGWLQAGQPAVLEVALGRDPHSLALWVRHLIATHCEPALEAEHDRGHDARFLQLSDQHDGTVRGRFRLTGEDAETLRTVLEPLARPAGVQDRRSAGQRRADALVEVFDLALRHSPLPDAGGARPHLSYLLPAGWAARTSGAAPTAFSVARGSAPLDPAGPSARPAPLDPAAALDPSAPLGCASAAWSGPQTRARIEAMLCDARISRVLLTQVGQVSSLVNLTDTVTPAQRRALVARDHGCTARGCTRPPAFCDAHHLQALADGGATDLDNLGLLCRRHHVLWHRGQLAIDQLRLPWRRQPTALAPPGISDG